MSTQAILELANGETIALSDLTLVPRTIGARVLLPTGTLLFAYGIPDSNFVAADSLASRLHGLIDAGVRSKIRLLDSCNLVLPTGILRDDGRIIGFVSDTEARATDPSLLDYLSVTHSRIPSQLLDLPNRVRIARQLAKKFSTLHSTGSTVGCFDPGQVRLALDNGKIFFINSWAFGLASNSGVPRSPLCALPMYRPLESHAPWKEVSWTPNQDNFELAVIIFQLLTFGRHPFGPTPGLQEEIFDLRQRQKAGLYWAKELDSYWLPQRLANLFELAFLTAKPELRPTAAEWEVALDIAVGQDTYERCLAGRDYRHDRYAVFAKHNCPICEPYKGAELAVPNDVVAFKNLASPTSSADPVEKPTAKKTRFSKRATIATVLVSALALYSLLRTKTEPALAQPTEAASAPGNSASFPKSSEAAASQPAVTTQRNIIEQPRNLVIDRDGEPTLVALRISINEPYALNGLKFPLAIDLHYYFSKLPWYKPQYSSSNLARLSAEQARVVEGLRSRLRQKQDEISRSLVVSEVVYKHAATWEPYKAQIHSMLATAFIQNSPEFYDSWLWLKSNEPSEMADAAQDALRKRLMKASTVNGRARVYQYYSDLKKIVASRPASHLALTELAMASKRLGRPDDEVLAFSYRAVIGRPNISSTWLTLGFALADRDEQLAAQAICTALRVSNISERTKGRIQELRVNQSIALRRAAAMALQKCVSSPLAI